MITDKIYSEQMNRLEALANYKFYPAAFKSWKKELDDSGYSDERLISAVDRIANSLTTGNLKSRDINYGTLNAACQAVRIDNKLQLRPAKEIPLTELTNPKREGLSPYAKACCEIIQAYTTGLIDKATYKARHTELNRKYGLQCR